MSERPAIYVLEEDFDRLSELLEKQPHGRETAEALEQELDRATLVKAEQLPPGTVTMNARVHFRNQTNGTEHTLTLVYPNQRAGDDECVSVLAPAGAALLGLQVGDRIDWPLAGKADLRLLIIGVTQAG